MSILDIRADCVAKGSGSAARRALTCRRLVVVECWVLIDVCVGGLVHSHISHFCSENIRLINSQQLMIFVCVLFALICWVLGDYVCLSNCS